jgi:hypothetical protein
VAAFLASEAGRGVSPSTIGRRVAAIRYAHKLAGFPITTDDERVRATVRGIRRSLGTAPNRKAPATADKIVAMAPVVGGRLSEIRDRALLLIQPPIVARSMTNPPESLSCAASVLARCARLLDLPVHHSVVPAGGKAPEVLPDLAKETEGAPQFARMTADPFLDPQTREAIDAVKRPVLVIAGCATEQGAPLGSRGRQPGERGRHT